METLTNVLISTGIFILIVLLMSVIYNLGQKYLEIFRDKLDEEISPQQWQMLESIVLSLVRAAEQIFGVEGDGEEKLNYVMGILKTRYPNLDTELLRAIVESIVFEYKEFRAIIVTDEVDEQ